MKLIPWKTNAKQERNTTLPERATDEMVITIWLDGRPLSTQETYQIDIKMLLDFTGKPLQQITLLDLQNFAHSLEGHKPASIHRKLSAAKSLFSFCHKAGYTMVNVGAALRLPKIQERLAERILPEAGIQRMLALETNLRNHALLRLMYNGGLRVSEVVALTWKDVQENTQGGQVRVTGKGEKERYVLISHETYQEVVALRGKMEDGDPVFHSRQNTNAGFLHRSQVTRIVRTASERAGISLKVSSHWLRHAHASHAIERGAPVTLVRDTLGHANIATTNKYSHAKPNTSSGTYLPI